MKIAKLTLCPKEIKGNIPEYEYGNVVDLMTHVRIWLDNINRDESIFVCFQTYNNAPYRNQVQSILVSHDSLEVVNYADELTQHLMPASIDLAIFEFESYEEAFKYCIDLKEGY